MKMLPFKLEESLSRYMSWAFTLTTVGVSVTVIGLVLLYRNQNALLYFPTPPGVPRHPRDNPRGFRSPGDWSTQGSLLSSQATHAIPYEENFLTTKDGARIHTWLMLQEESSSTTPTLIYFHGNAGNMGFRLPNAIKMYTRAKFHILMMDYRGYGDSEGTPSEEGLNLDAEAVLGFVGSHPRLKNSPILLFGRSLGGAVSVSLAHKYASRVHGIILENTFLSISAMVDILMRWLSPIKTYVLKIKWDSETKIQELKHPILFISGDSDQLVPPFHMKMLFDKARMSKHRDFYSVAGGTHNDTWEVAGLEYYRRLRNFADIVIECMGRAASHVDNHSLDDEDENSNFRAHIPTMDRHFHVR